MSQTQSQTVSSDEVPQVRAVASQRKPEPAPGVPSQRVSRPRDEVIFRLNKLFAPTKDLGSVLTTFNYSLYLLAYVDHKAHQIKSRTLSFIKHETPTTTASGSSVLESSAFGRLGAVVSDARLTLRLFALLPIYVQARKLMQGPKNTDGGLYGISVAQCSLFAIFQLLENVAFLTDKKVISDRLFGRWLGGPAGRVSAMYKLAHRAWFLGIMCEFVRLIREAQLFFWRSQIQKETFTEDEANKAANWYYEWIQPLAWLPIGWELSRWTEGGLPGFNLGLRGIAGTLADLRATTRLWNATKTE